jgi:hypothetical protein
VQLFIFPPEKEKMVLCGEVFDHLIILTLLPCCLKTRFEYSKLDDYQPADPNKKSAIKHKTIKQTRTKCQFLVLERRPI